MSISDLMNYTISSEQKRKLDSSVIRDNSRPDICLWNKKGRIQYVIEIKRRWENGSAKKDIKRCGDFLRIFAGENGIGTRAAYFGLILHKSKQNQGRIFFGSEVGEDTKNDEAEQILKERAEKILEDGRRAKLKVLTKVSKIHDYSYNKDWPAGEGSEEYQHHWKWRAAVVEIKRA